MNEVIYTVIPMEELTQLIKNSIREELDTVKEKEVLTAKEVCEMLGISISTLNSWKRNRKIPYKKEGKRIFFIRQDVLSNLQNAW